MACKRSTHSFPYLLRIKRPLVSRKEEAVIERTKEEVKEAIKLADQAPKQKISDFLKNMYETPDFITAEQIKKFEAKENN